jgi:hypothetical protein
MKGIFLRCACIFIATAGCVFEKPGNVLSSADHPGIWFSVEKRIELFKRSLELFAEDSAGVGKRGSPARKKIVDFDYTTLHIAHIRPVAVGADSVQANDIVIHGNSAIIAYNCAGDKFAGALQIVDITKPDSPAIAREIVFQDCGVTVVYGGAANPAARSYRSFVGMLALGKVDLSSMFASTRPLPSFAVTGIGGAGAYWFASCGAQNGTVVVLDQSLAPVDTLGVPDARDVAAFEAGFCVLSGTTDNSSSSGCVSVFNSDASVRFSKMIPDFRSAYHKATVEIVDGRYAALALSEAGCIIISLQDGETVFSCSNPAPSDPELLTNTNSVSTDGNLLFTANGNFGFRVFELKNGDFSNAALIGCAPFEQLKVGNDHYSANHVAFKGNHLFVASGVGGVNIYTFVHK